MYVRNRLISSHFFFYCQDYYYKMNGKTHVDKLGKGCKQSLDADTAVCVSASVEN